MKKSNSTTLDELLDREYGEMGTESRKRFEERYEDFKLKVLIQQVEEEQNITQQELTEKSLIFD